MELLQKLSPPALAAVAAVTSILLTQGPVLADGRRAPAAPVVQQAPTSWSGFYFGAHAGWSWSEFDATRTDGSNVFSVSHDAQIVGGQIGLQHQFGNFVLGVEGGLSVAYQDDYASERCSALFECAARFDDVLTIGPRFGWAMGKWMPYITGGYANGAFSAKAVNRLANVQPVGGLGTASPANSHERHSGWYIGAGIDMIVANGWTIGLEYRHLEFSDATYQPAANLTGGFIGLGNPFSADPTVDTIALRVSWKLDRPAPAAAPMK